MHITFRNEQLFHISDYPWADPSARMAGSMQAGSRCSPCSRCAPPRRAPCPSGGALARLAHGRRAEVAGACGVARGGASGAAGEAACGRVRMQPPGRGTHEATGYAARRSRLGATRGGVAAVRGRGHQHGSDARRAVHAPSSSTPLMLPPASAPARSGSSAPPASVSAASSAALASPLDGPLFLPNFSVPWKLK